MRKYILGLSLVSLLIFLFTAGFIFYQKYSLAAEISNASTPPTGENAPVPAAINLAEEEKYPTFPVDAAAPVAQPPAIEEDSSSDKIPAEKKPDTAKARPDADCPGDILNLANWKQTLPTGKSKKPAEIEQPALADYNSDPYFKINAAKNGVVCRAPVNGVTTSNSGYPRSELREMSDNGRDLASWSTTSGTNTMFIDQAITAVPKNKKHVVAGQIHDASDDVIVIRLEYPKLFVDINGKPGPVLDPNYTLGKRFTVKFIASNGQIKVYYNGSPTPIYTLAKKATGCYFKAGAYTQSNCSKESDCSNNNFGEVVLYNLSVTH